MKDTGNATNPNYTIIEVWNSNLEEEFRKIRKIVQKYPFVAMVLLKTFCLYLVFIYAHIIYI